MSERGRKKESRRRKKVEKMGEEDGAKGKCGRRERERGGWSVGRYFCACFVFNFSPPLPSPPLGRRGRPRRERAKQSRAARLDGRMVVGWLDGWMTGWLDGSMVGWWCARLS